MMLLFVFILCLCCLVMVYVDYRMLSAIRKELRLEKMTERITLIEARIEHIQSTLNKLGIWKMSA